MGPVKRLLAAAVGTVAATAALLALAPPASADAVSDAEKALRNAPVYVASGATVKIDQSAVASSIGTQPIKIAVLPTGSTTTDLDQARRIMQALGGKVTVGVIGGHTFNAVSSVLCQNSAGALAQEVVAAHLTQLQADSNVTVLLSDFAGKVATGPLANTAACGRSSAAGRSDQSSTKSGGSAWPWVLGLGALGLIGGGGRAALVVSRRRRRLKELEGRRADVLSLYDRLGADVQNLDAKDNPVARQAIADASERYNSTGSLLSHADTEGEYAAARRTALEGLQAARTARTALGLDPGPELPPIAPTYGEQLAAPQEVSVGDRTYQGYPEYTPGAPYYYGGGGGAPGGWYSFPFWETLLLGSVLGGGLGGWGGGGYGAGYDQGYQAGEDAADDRTRDSGGGDWAGSDWGSGGGDWGGGGGGGDWGGGGGDWGGGDSGGGSW